MAYRYTTPQENEEIRRLYRTGEYSFKQLAEIKHLSKATVINIVKGYPYGVYKQVYSKLQEGTAGSWRSNKTRGSSSTKGIWTRKLHSIWQPSAAMV